MLPLGSASALFAWGLTSRRFARGCAAHFGFGYLSLIAGLAEGVLMFIENVLAACHNGRIDAYASFWKIGGIMENTARWTI